MKKTMKTGGDLGRRAAFKHIESIGFEIETTDLINLNVTKVKGQEVLVNPEIYNCTLEKNQCVDIENVYIVNEPDVKFKITTDTASDSGFNTYLREIYEDAGPKEASVGGRKKGGAGEDEDEEEEEEYDEEDEEGDEGEEGESEDEPETEDEDDAELPSPIYSLTVPANPLLKKPTYDVFLKRRFGSLYSGFDEDEETGEMEINSFTDTEYICTFYKPNTSKNVIRRYVSEMIEILYSHISKLKVINGVELTVKNRNDEQKVVENIPNQLYVLPDTNLCYYNSSMYKNSSYNITTDMAVVLQMTFGVNIQHLYKTVKQLLHIDSTIRKKTKETTKYINAHKKNPNVKELVDLMDDYKRSYTVDVFYIDSAYNTVNKLVQNYIRSNPEYAFTSSKLITDLQAYLFIIFYQLIVYLNSYIENKSPLKYYLSFVFRHRNLDICAEIKRTIAELVAPQLEGKSKEEIDEIVSGILIKIINQPKLLRRLYYSNFISNVRKQYLKDVEENTIDPNANPIYASPVGNPLYSIVSYFERLTKNKDYIIFAYTDSTIFPIKNNTVIVEFRDFPTYIYLDAFMSATNEQRNEIIKRYVGTLTLKTLTEYASINTNRESVGGSGAKKSKKLKCRISHRTRKNHRRRHSASKTRKAQ